MLHLLTSAQPCWISADAWSRIVRFAGLLESVPAMAVTAPDHLAAHLVSVAYADLTVESWGRAADPATVKAEAAGLGAAYLAGIKAQWDRAGLELGQARAYLRYLACALSDLDQPIEQVAYRLHALAGNDGLTVGEVRAALEGAGNEAPFEALRTAARQLRDGASVRQAVAASGLSLGAVSGLGQFLGAADASAERLADEAWAAVLDGTSVSAFAREQGIHRKSATRLMAAARTAAVELGELAA